MRKWGTPDDPAADGGAESLLTDIVRNGRGTMDIRAFDLIEAALRCVTLAKALANTTGACANAKEIERLLS
jgi:hypothetical protein